MSRCIRSLAAVLVVMVALAGAGLSAAQAKGKSQKSQSITGTLQKVDGQTLTIQTSKGVETVMLASSARIRSGTKTLAASDLPAQSGSRVKVTYRETNGHKEAQAVTVSSAAKAAATKPAKTAPKKPA
jgi:hypothetical protein